MNAMSRGIAFVLVLMATYGPTLATAKSYKWSCTYPTEASPDGVKAQTNFKLDFAFDDITGKAVLVGNNGVADVDVHIGSEAISFMEKLKTGAVQNTIISSSGDSVHSRHTLMTGLGKMVPSQSYGQCVRQ